MSRNSLVHCEHGDIGVSSRNFCEERVFSLTPTVSHELSRMVIFIRKSQWRKLPSLHVVWYLFWSCQAVSEPSGKYLRIIKICRSYLSLWWSVSLWYHYSTLRLVKLCDKWGNYAPVYHLLCLWINFPRKKCNTQWLSSHIASYQPQKHILAIPSSGLWTKLYSRNTQKMH